MNRTKTLRRALGLLTIPALAGCLVASHAQATALAGRTAKTPNGTATRQVIVLPEVGNAIMARNGSGPAHLTTARVVRDGRLIHMTKPAYPLAAKLAQVTGVVTVEARIGKDGNVIETCVLRGPYALRRVAEDAVKHWQYEPATLNGEPVQRIALVNLKFDLGRYADLMDQ